MSYEKDHLGPFAPRNPRPPKAANQLNTNRLRRRTFKDLTLNPLVLLRITLA